MGEDDREREDYFDYDSPRERDLRFLGRAAAAGGGLLLLLAIVAVFLLAAYHYAPIAAR